MRIVIVGATGNVGSALVEALLGVGDIEVTGVARRLPATTSSDGQASSVQWVSADVSSDALDMFEGADAVVHLAWQIQPTRDEPHLHRVNVGGTSRVVEAVRRHRVPRLVIASSVGAYSARVDHRLVDENWPTGGVPTSVYSRQKAEVERLLDRTEASEPRLEIVRMRTSLVFARRAAAEIDRYFLGPRVPTRLIGRGRLPVLPCPSDIAFQAVHSDDAADAYLRAATSDVRGAFNIAAEPVLDRGDLADALHARPITAPRGLLRFGAQVTHALRLQRTSTGWIDLGFNAPLMATSRARELLGWTPLRSATDVLGSLIAGLAENVGADSPPLHPKRDQPMERIRW